MEIFISFLYLLLIQRIMLMQHVYLPLSLSVSRSQCLSASLSPPLIVKHHYPHSMLRSFWLEPHSLSLSLTYSLSLASIFPVCFFPSLYPNLFISKISILLSKFSMSVYLSIYYKFSAPSPSPEREKVSKNQRTETKYASISYSVDTTD